MDSPPYKAGIVGSRRRNTLHDRKIVFRLVELLLGKFGRDGLVIVSGGCPKGADLFAEEGARVHGVRTEIYPVDRKGVTTKWEFRQAAFARNKTVAEMSTGLFCLVSSDRTGGTENTVGHMLELKRPVFLLNEAGEIYLAREDGSFPLCDPAVRLLG